MQRGQPELPGRTVLKGNGSLCKLVIVAWCGSRCSSNLLQVRGSIMQSERNDVYVYMY